MVTRAQVEKLASRIDALEIAIGVPSDIEDELYLHFIGDTEEEFYAHHPDAPRPFADYLVLSFD